MKKAKKLFLKSTLMMEGISYLVLVPLAIYVVFYHGGLLGERFKYSVKWLAIAITITLIHGLIIRYFGLYKPVKSIYQNSNLNEKELHDIKLQLLNYPQKEAISASIRCVYGIAFVIFLVNFYVTLEINTYVAAIAGLLQSILINFINNYFIAERLISDVLEEPTLSEIIVDSMEYKEFSRIKKTVITIVGMSVAVYIVISYLLFAVINGTIPKEQVLIHFGFITFFLIALLTVTINMFNYSNRKSLTKIKDSIEKMSKGELTADLSMISIDELGKVCSDLLKLKLSLRDIAGFISSETRNLYGHSELLGFDREITSGETMAMEDKLEKHDLDNLFGVTEALQQISEVLRDMISLNSNQNYISNGRLKLNSAIQNAQTLSDVADEVVKNLATHVNATVGTLYVLEDNYTLKLAGGFAHSQRGNLPNKFKLGEGMIGQAAIDKEIKIVEGISENHLIIDTGVVQILPKNLIIIPCVYKDRTEAVAVLGSMETFEDNHVKFFTTIGESIALTISSHQANAAKEKLLNETQALAKELREQQEELMASNVEIEQMNEELEQQAHELRKSEVLLESQQQELKAVNEELRLSSLDMERQRDELNEKNEELHQTQKLLEEKAANLERANQYKSEFLANMSHELRTPLNSIIILSKIMYDNKHNVLPDKEVQYSETIYKAANDLLELINEILDLAKVEAGMMDVNLEKFDLRYFAEDIKLAFKEVAATKSIDFSVEIEAGLPQYVETDAQRLKQIIKNLLSNAFKFTQEGFVAMKVTRYNNENLIAFSISDSGIGISEEKQELIFKEFNQGDGATNRKYGGTGLGLSISEKFSKLLGGEIQLSSKENEGSTFTLLIPEKSLGQTFKEVEKPKRIEKSIPIENVEVPKKNKKLLIIDDDANFVKVVTDIARSKGFICLSALDGEKGLELAKNFKPDAIILDIKLPGIDGWEVMKQLNENENTRNIPVHFISSLDMPKNALETGAVGYTTKPLTGQKLDDIFKGLDSSMMGIREIATDESKKLLVIQEKGRGKDLIEQIEREGIPYLVVTDFQEANSVLEQKNVSSILVDFSLELDDILVCLSNLKNNEKTSSVPVILYSDDILSWEEEVKLKKYVESIIIKDGYSEKRLINEITLFLHHIGNHHVNSYSNKKEKKHHNHRELLTEKNILIVDDDMRNVFALTSILESNGAKVIFAKNGKEGLTKLKENNNLDLILMDIMMPELNGYETMKEVRKMEEYKNIPIIALTAKAMKGDKEKCFEAGANDYMSKPLDVDKLLSLIKVWLQK